MFSILLRQLSWKPSRHFPFASVIGSVLVQFSNIAVTHRAEFWLEVLDVSDAIYRLVCWRLNLLCRYVFCLPCYSCQCWLLCFQDSKIHRHTQTSCPLTFNCHIASSQPIITRFVFSTFISSPISFAQLATEFISFCSCSPVSSIETMSSAKSRSVTLSPSAHFSPDPLAASITRFVTQSIATAKREQWWEYAASWTPDITPNHFPSDPLTRMMLRLPV